MAREAVRIAVVTAVEALRASWVSYDLKVEYDNLLIDMSAQSNPFLRVTINYMDAFQADLSRHPTHRAVGGILVEALAKESTGTKAQNLLLELIYPALQMRDNLTPIHTHAAKFLPPQRPVNGWSNLAVVIPFWHDTTI